MIYTSECIYKNIKSSISVESEAEFYDLLKNKKIMDDDLVPAFSDLRLKIGENFKLDNVSFLMGNGCSIYAGSKSTMGFSLTDLIKEEDYADIQDVVSNVSGMGMETQLNALITIKDYYMLTKQKEKRVLVESLITRIKENLLTDFVNGMDYTKLNWHEVLLLKLRSYGCLKKTNIYTTNYDLAFEYLMDKMAMEYVNGFSGFVNRRFDTKSLLGRDITKLVKIHGSVNWCYDDKENLIKEFQPMFEDGHVVLDKKQQVLIYPTAEKLYQTYNEPYSELMRIMLNDMETKRNVVFVLGYKYGDEHINDILYKALANPNNIFYFFDYDNDGQCDFIEKMKKMSESVQNVNIVCGHFMASFDTFVKYMVPATAERTDEEKIIDLLKKVME